MTEHWRIQPDFMQLDAARRVFNASVGPRVKEWRAQAARSRKAYRTSPHMVAMCNRLADAYEAAAKAFLKTAMEGFEP